MNLENLLSKVASAEEYGMVKLSADEQAVIEAIGQAYLAGLQDGMVKMAQELTSDEDTLENVDPEEVIAAVEEAVANGELEPEEGAEIINNLDKTASSAAANDAVIKMIRANEALEHYKNAPGMSSPYIGPWGRRVGRLADIAHYRVSQMWNYVKKNKNPLAVGAGAAAAALYLHNKKKNKRG